MTDGIHFKRFVARAGKVIHRARVFSIRPVHVRAPNGRRFEHHIVFHPGAAVVVPVLPGERFVLVRQYRAAAQRALLEFPAGTLESKESPLECAKREIIEETGYRARRWKRLGSFYPAPGVSTEFMHLFLATGLSPAQGVPDLDEFLEREIISFPRLQKLIFQGTIVDGKTLLGFFYYCRFRPRGVR